MKSKPAIERATSASKPRDSYKYPFRRMGIGDSFFVAGKQPDDLAAAGRYYKPMKFKAHLTTQNGVFGARIVRIA